MTVEEAVTTLANMISRLFVDVGKHSEKIIELEKSLYFTQKTISNIFVSIDNLTNMIKILTDRVDKLEKRVKKIIKNKD